MESLNIRNFNARYHLPKRALAERRRLDRAMTRLANEGLETAFVRAGLQGTGEICVRDIDVTLRLQLSAPESTLAEVWSAAVIASVRQQIESECDSVVRYASRAQAITDLVRSVARGDFSRAWAWKQLGLWDAGEAASRDEAARQVVRSLVREPQSIVAVLSDAAGHGELALFLGAFEVRYWIALASAALSATGAPVDWRDLMEVAVLADDGRSQEPQDLVLKVVRGSRIARATAAFGTGREAVRALAALALMEAEPALLRRVPEQVLSAIDAAGRVIERLQQVEEGKLLPVADTRKDAVTRYAGLLFLLNVVDSLSIPERLPYRRMIYRLSLALLPGAEGDPAALAFAGLPPESDPPNADEEPLSIDELNAIRICAGEVTAELQDRLAEMKMPDAELIDWLCTRPGRIVCDPGWIEVHLSLRDASTAVRRAALDLDPGFLPWLGVVVKFIYE